MEVHEVVLLVVFCGVMHIVVGGAANAVGRQYDGWAEFFFMLLWPFFLLRWVARRIGRAWDDMRDGAVAAGWRELFPKRVKPPRATAHLSKKPDR